MKIISALVAFIVLCCVPVSAQEDGSSARFLAGIKAKNPKTVVAVFDISNSMSHTFPGKLGPVLDVARPFAQDLVNGALRKGDRFVLYSFDKAPKKVFDAEINGNQQEILDAIPNLNTLSKVQGTNIRWAHYEGLKIMESEAKANRPAYLVVLSDGFHDSPDAGDPNYTDFYIPLRLDKLPDTDKARDYTRLANRFKGQNLGVGVQISNNGMVVESPSSIPPSTSSKSETEAEKQERLKTEEDKRKNEEEDKQRKKLLLFLGLGALAAAILGFGLRSLFFKPIRVGLGQPNDPKKNKIFPMKHGSRIILGGVGASAIPSAFEVPQTKAAVGHIVRSGQNFWLSSVENQPDGAGLVVNGQPVNGRQQISFGDQIRVKFASGDRDQLFTWNQASAFRTLLNL